jgi:hypothetical protein
MKEGTNSVGATAVPVLEFLMERPFYLRLRARKEVTPGPGRPFINQTRHTGSHLTRIKEEIPPHSKGTTDLLIKPYTGDSE